MAGEPAQKKRRLPFNPPSRASSTAGPSTSASKAKGKAKQTTTKSSSSASASKSTNGKSTPTSKRARAQSPPSSPAASDGASDAESGSDSSSHSRERSVSQEPDFILAEITTAQHETEDMSWSEPAIPSKLLTRLLHHHFTKEKTKVAKDANAVVAKYVDVFVREAIARAAYERAETDGTSGARGIGDGFLEVEDLEKMAPQLTMDF
ncbi:hypothetical protein N7474_004669 [Penicillium riverlandense]|uniref:uncharacterized protein n=1 Tax=Penicillium riverlandense TaxID=1903569 RepID=UPI002546DC0A|nr:uncharacterized protein N7474_004669 [Penicillium riverlandense]KAJ5819078.1 hypothetical protein N7474_004669 [Penicillium riverlandense]